MTRASLIGKPLDVNLIRKRGMTPDTPQISPTDMQAMLLPCRRRMALASVCARLRVLPRAGAKALLGVAAIFLFLRALSWLAATPAPGMIHVLASLALIGLVLFLRALASGLHDGRKQTHHAAESLDLAHATHNRIATAIALLQTADNSPFARAAIRDGFEHLQRLKSQKPHSDPTTLRWKRTCLSSVAGLTLILVGLGLSPKVKRVGNGMKPNAAIAESGITNAEIDPASQPQDPHTHDTQKVTRDRLGKPPDAARKEERSERPEPGSRSEGGMGREAAGESGSGQAVSKTSSAASGGGAKPEPGESEAAKPTPKPGERKPQEAARPKPAGEEKQGGSISASGSSGAGSMQSSQNEWSSKVKAKADDSDDFQADEAADEDMDPDKQRLGVQPALKSRSARISRELSLMMGLDPSNQQKRGRGGPGGQKKSRGTATMIMGVPVPGFLRGRLLAGPTKSTQEEVEPSPRDGEFAAAFDFPETLPEEDAQERFRAPAPMGESARDYLIQYHDDHENRRDDAAPGE
jgi:hypothetical protein